MCLKLTYYKIVWVRVKVEVLGTGNPNPNLTLNVNGFFFFSAAFPPHRPEPGPIT